jgi:hypothetical protein
MKKKVEMEYKSSQPFVTISTKRSCFASHTHQAPVHAPKCLILSPQKETKVIHPYIKDSMDVCKFMNLVRT